MCLIFIDFHSRNITTTSFLLSVITVTTIFIYEIVINVARNCSKTVWLFNISRQFITIVDNFFYLFSIVNKLSGHPYCIEIALKPSPSPQTVHLWRIVQMAKTKSVVYWWLWVVGKWTRAMIRQSFHTCLDDITFLYPPHWR